MIPILNSQFKEDESANAGQFADIGAVQDVSEEEFRR